MTQSFDDKLHELASDYKGKADHYQSIGDHYMSAVYWGCYTGVFYASCAYQTSRLEEVRKMEIPFDDAA